MTMREVASFGAHVKRLPAPVGRSFFEIQRDGDGLVRLHVHPADGRESIVFGLTVGEAHRWSSPLSDRGYFRQCGQVRV